MPAGCVQLLGTSALQALPASWPAQGHSHMGDLPGALILPAAAPTPCSPSTLGDAQQQCLFRAKLFMTFVERGKAGLTRVRPWLWAQWGEGEEAE